MKTKIRLTTIICILFFGSPILAYSNSLQDTVKKRIINTYLPQVEVQDETGQIISHNHPDYLREYVQWLSQNYLLNHDIKINYKINVTRNMGIVSARIGDQNIKLNAAGIKEGYEYISNIQSPTDIVSQIQIDRVTFFITKSFNYYWIHVMLKNPHHENTFCILESPYLGV